MKYREFVWTRAKLSEIGMGTYYGHLYEVLFPLFLQQRDWSRKKKAFDEGLNLFFDQTGWHTKIAALRKGASFLFHGGSRSEKIAALKKGLEFGINLIDTAELYQTEDLVAEAIKDYKREDVFIATKVSGSHLQYGNVLKAANNSLSKLASSYIDLYQIHWPNSSVTIRETMRAMEKLVEEGKIRYIGVSNFSLEQLKEAEAALSKNKLASIQVEYSLIARGVEKELLPYCELKNIAVLAYKPIGQGILAGPNVGIKIELDEISKMHGGKSSTQIAINWLLSKSKVVFPIPRASRPTRVIENVGSVDWSLNVNEMQRLCEIFGHLCD